MKEAVRIVSIVCGLIATALCVFTLVQLNKRQVILDSWQRELDAISVRFDHSASPSPKFAWEQRVSIVGGFYRGRDGEVQEVIQPEDSRRREQLNLAADGRFYCIRLDGFQRSVYVLESDLAEIPEPTKPGDPAALNEIEPRSGALFYRNHAGDLYRGKVDTVKPLQPGPYQQPPPERSQQ